MNKIGAFSYVDGTLCCDGIPIPRILETAPSCRELTPAYIYSRRQLIENCETMKKAFYRATVRYATKACMNVVVMNQMRQLGFGFDVVSHGELGRAKLAGAQGSEIVYAGAAKTDSDIAEAVAYGVTIVVECEEELKLIRNHAHKLDKQVRILLRLRPNVDAHTHGHLTTGRAFSKFGMPESIVRKILDSWKDPMVKIVGIHFHIGSQIESPKYTAQAMEVALPIIDKYNLAVLDIGGGFPVCYTADGTAPTLNEFADIVYGKIGERELELIIEPGRSLVANTGILVTTVMSQEYGEFETEVDCVLGKEKKLEDRRIVRVDGGMADLIRPMLYGAYHQIWEVQKETSPFNPIAIEFDGIDKIFIPGGTPTSIAGPFCESTDFLGRDLFGLPDLNRGMMLAVMHAGAYGRAMASNYNGNLIGPELMVDINGSVLIIGERESFGHSIALESLV